MRTLRRARERGLGRESERRVTAEVKVALALRRKEGQDDRSPRSSGGNSSDGFHSRSTAGVRAFRGTGASWLEGKAAATAALRAAQLHLHRITRMTPAGANICSLALTSSFHNGH
ncbi:hypothetical protein MTO96_023364 [Rhipicephalus appendiculatus]